jgi:copper(I)-binding protein
MRRIFSLATSTLAAFALAACAGTPARMNTEQAPAAQPAQAPAVTLGSLTINDTWVRPANPNAPAPTPMPDATAAPADGMAMAATVNTGGYMTIANSGAETDYLIGASAASDVAGTVELHTVVEENGVMKMNPVERIEVPAGGEATLKPGSFHVMFIGVQKELKPGDTVKLNLTFEKAGSVEVDAVVRPANPMP